MFLFNNTAGEKVAAIQREPTEHPQQTTRDNIERVLQFMSAKRIKMVHITSKDVIEGNLKSIMRIILALAAHYKPQSVRCPPQSQQQMQITQKNQITQVGAALDSSVDFDRKANGGREINDDTSAVTSGQELLSSSKRQSNVPVRHVDISQGKQRNSKIKWFYLKKIEAAIKKWI